MALARRISMFHLSGDDERPFSLWLSSQKEIPSTDSSKSSEKA